MGKQPARPRTTRSPSEIEELYEDQMNVLRERCEHFDKGHTVEYRRIAHSLRVLAYNHRQSVSLLSQMGLLNRNYLNSARQFHEANQLSECNLIEVVYKPSTGKPARYRAILDTGPMEFVDFETWWNAPVFTDQKHSPLSRQDLVKFVANQDGGSHVDPGIDEAFHKMRTEGFKWTDGRAVVDEPERHAIRQIGHELLKSLLPTYRRPRVERTPVVTMHSPVFREAGPKPSEPILSYHLADLNEPCGCGSGETFRRCHREGVVTPRELQHLTKTMQAPPGTAYARVGFGVSD